MYFCLLVNMFPSQGGNSQMSPNSVWSNIRPLYAHLYAHINDLLRESELNSLLILEILLAYLNLDEIKWCPSES